jgi:hypothetical protein
MKTLFSASALAIAAAIAPSHAHADDWMLRVETSSRVCHVQLKTASPLGADLKGHFSSRKRACQEAINQYDDSGSDQKRCWRYGGGTISGCKSDGITLPPAR